MKIKFEIKRHSGKRSYADFSTGSNLDEHLDSLIKDGYEFVQFIPDPESPYDGRIIVKKIIDEYIEIKRPFNGEFSSGISGL